MFIPGWLINTVTFPGIILHESAHRFFCDLTKTEVYEISYFRIGNPSGYVIHKKVNSLKKSFAISIGPLLINTFICAILCFPVALTYFILDIDEGGAVINLLAWIGFSCGMHAFPSNQDVDSFMYDFKSAKKDILYFITLPFAFLLKFANLLSIIWFDLIYAIGISVSLPYLFIELAVA